MIKATLILGSLLVLTTAAVIQFNETECKSLDGLWPSEDGTKFYFCIGGIPYEQSCPPNTFYIQNATCSGCVPIDEVSDNCVYHQELQPCEGEVMHQPQPHLDPTKFYVCLKENAEPVEFSCPEDKAFVKQSGYLGCFEWALWRKIRECE